MAMTILFYVFELKTKQQQKCTSEYYELLGFYYISLVVYDSPIVIFPIFIFPILTALCCGLSFTCSKSTIIPLDN